VFNTPGHYFSGFRTDNRKWAVLDDAQVTTYTADTFRDFCDHIGYARPYLLVYLPYTGPSTSKVVKPPKVEYIDKVSKEARYECCLKCSIF
jgi:hypothetical protein